ncbi:MAG: hypothetical protein P4L90_02025 [Rhodopila sp.]|nr:hypothetical protein [Rhodopila sp.]
MSSEKRWIVLAEDGRHTTLGRHTDPTQEEIERAAVGLKAAGLGGWLAVMEGDYYRSRCRVDLLMVREIAPGQVTWDAAMTAFHGLRAQALGPSH